MRPRSSAPSTAVAGMSRRSAAASTVDSSPESSAAATRSSARTCSDAASTPRAYARSTRLEIGTGVATASSGSPSRLHSVIASGSPWVLRKISSTPPLSGRRPISLDASRPVASRSSAGTVSSSSRAASSAGWGSSRAARIIPTGAPASRRPRTAARRATARRASARRPRTRARAVSRCEQRAGQGGRAHEEAVALDGRARGRAPRPARRAAGQAARGGDAAPVAAPRAHRRTRPPPRPGCRRPAALSGPRRAPQRTPAVPTCPPPGTPRSISAAPAPARVAPISDSRRSHSPCRPTSMRRA